MRAPLALRRPDVLRPLLVRVLDAVDAELRRVAQRRSTVPHRRLHAEAAEHLEREVALVSERREVRRRRMSALRELDVEPAGEVNGATVDAADIAVEDGLRPIPAARRMRIAVLVLLRPHALKGELAARQLPALAGEDGTLEGIDKVGMLVRV